MSSSITRILGYTADEVVGRTCFELIHPRDQNLATSLLQQPSVQAIVANYRDITTRKQLEEVLHRTIREEACLEGVRSILRPPVTVGAAQRYAV